jgi:methylase of polypeptide subunit release factors
MKKRTNEWELQGEANNWLNQEIALRPGMGLGKATQEPSKLTAHRSDLVVWINRVAEDAFLAIEVKTPKTPISDVQLFRDAEEKARRWGAPYFAIWNMQCAELYRMVSKRAVTPSDQVRSWPLDTRIRSVEDWLEPTKEKRLRERVIEILDAAWRDSAESSFRGTPIESSMFVDRLANRINTLRLRTYYSLRRRTAADRKLRRRLNALAAAQGFIGFVDDVDAAVAGQCSYRLVGQILFYYALRRKQPNLPELKVDPNATLPGAFRPYWDAVRRFDYEALFAESELDRLVPLDSAAQLVVRHLVDELASYDWNSVRDDVLGSVFERLIPRQEQILLGQFYTPGSVADVLVAFCVEGKNSIILDPACGSGTFLMRAYDFQRARYDLRHAALLESVWGFDISPFATQLAAINLFRQDMKSFDNFPRVVPGNFFDRMVGDAIPFPPAQAGAAEAVELRLPAFDAVLGNPPYLRSQNQDDLDPAYKGQLFRIARSNGVIASKKTDLFAFFVYHALGFLKPGGRLGFVTSSSWLTAAYGGALQSVLLGRLRLVAVITSAIEPLFPHVDVNTVLVVAEARANGEAPNEDERVAFVSLRKPLVEAFGGPAGGWESLLAFSDRVESSRSSWEDDCARVTVVPLQQELDALHRNPGSTRNWSRYLRAPLSYYELFGMAS